MFHISQVPCGILAEGMEHVDLPELPALAQASTHQWGMPQEWGAELQWWLCRQLNLQEQRFALCSCGLWWHWLSHTCKAQQRQAEGERDVPGAVTFHATLPLKEKSLGEQPHLKIPGVGALDSGW